MFATVKIRTDFFASERRRLRQVRRTPARADRFLSPAAILDEMGDEEPPPNRSLIEAVGINGRVILAYVSLSQPAGMLIVRFLHFFTQSGNKKWSKLQKSNTDSNA